MRDTNFNWYIIFKCGILVNFTKFFIVKMVIGIKLIEKSNVLNKKFGSKIGLVKIFIRIIIAETTHQIFSFICKLLLIKIFFRNNRLLLKIQPLFRFNKAVNMDRP